MSAARPDMVATVRMARGWTQRQLAERAELTPSSVSQIESGRLELAGATLTRVANALECPEILLATELPESGVDVTCLHHRRRSSTMTAGTRKRVEALTHLTRVSVRGLLADVALRPQLPLNRPTVALAEDPVAVARQVREVWQLPTGAIANLTRVLEAAGIIIVARDLHTSGQDAVSSWPADEHERPIIVVRNDLPTDRWRFTLAHELGHLLMHAWVEEGQEEQANEFASEFLAPAAAVIDDLAGLRTGDFARLLTVKRKWGISVAALIRRAFTLELISERQYREFHVRLNQMHWRRVEPGTLPPEQPSILNRVVKLRLGAGDRLDTIADDARMSVQAFSKVFLEPEQPRLALDLEAP
ncbi:helix-turn-helix domain-containing protein [Curtobacterium flaccumfaciens]|uniref:helix-turn-helix domain-containing protein n=1 Tax=Curtobacterium flaccumfaciens TaxID=2035 RepID=UPI00160010F2|nr:XRE family transcriptional regulator [Curtobacterium flaccumfaciens]MBB1195859.1 ImmA/IrrE family metallo-endopeptidase [Curtobacterium flaccumfaciens]